VFADWVAAHIAVRRRPDESHLETKRRLRALLLPVKSQETRPSSFMPNLVTAKS